MPTAEIERRTIVSDTAIEYREADNGEKRPVIVGYAAVFDSLSKNLGGFVESINPRAFDEVLTSNPDVVGVFNHDKNMILARTSNGTMKLKADPYGLRYEMMPPKTKAADDVVELISGGYVTGSSFAFAVSREGGDSWSTGPDGVRRREIRSISLLDDVGPVVRPAYEASSVVVGRRAIEMALGEAYRPNQTMANAARKGLRASRPGFHDQRLAAIAERIVERSILSVEEVEFLAETHRRCQEVKSTGWSGSPAWTDWLLAGGDAGNSWSRRRTQGKQVQERAEPGELSEGDFASWDGGMGRVEHIMSDGTLQGMRATEESPLAVLTPFDGSEPEDYMVAKSVAELTKTSGPVDAEGEGEGEDEDEAEDRAAGDKSQSTPAPEKDRIAGSDKNRPGSAKNASGKIKVSQAVRAGHQNKVRDHNASMREDEKPSWSRTTLGQLLAVYRRGAGAYSTSHRPGVSRAAWAMARVNAYLYLLRNGRPKDAKYTTDNDLLPSDHPRSSKERSEDAVLEERAVDLKPTAGMAAAAERGLRLHEEGKSGDGLKPETVARANKIARREELTPEHVREMNAWFARHEKASKSPGWDTPGEEKPGFVAWLLWSGDAGQVWSARKVAQMDREAERSEVVVVEQEQVPEVEPQAEQPTVAEPVKKDPVLEAKVRLAELNAALLRTRLHDDS